MSTCQTCPTCHCSPRFTLLFLMYIFLVGVDVVQTVRSLGHVCMCKCTVDVYVKISYLSDLSYMYKCLMPPASPLYYGTVPRCYPSPIWGILQGVHPISSRPELAWLRVLHMSEQQQHHHHHHHHHQHQQTLKTNGRILNIILLFGHKLFL